MTQKDNFESIRDFVIQQVFDNVGNLETYIVCDIYARFSIYLVDIGQERLNQLKKILDTKTLRVEKIKKGDVIYNDLNHPDFLKPQRIDINQNIFYVDRQTQLTNWNITDRYNSKAPITCFYSFKGGLGRTTALVLSAIHLARKGEKVIILDFDLEAPGLASLFEDQEESIAQVKGIVDYIVDLLSLYNDRSLIDITDYFFTINKQDIVGTMGGEIIVFPGGVTESEENLYLSKLSKVNTLFSNKKNTFSIDILLDHINTELNPSCILIDTRCQNLKNIKILNSI